MPELSKSQIAAAFAGAALFVAGAAFGLPVDSQPDCASFGAGQASATQNASCGYKIVPVSDAEQKKMEQLFKPVSVPVQKQAARHLGL